MARIWLTNRFGFHSASSLQHGADLQGSSLAPYDRLNLGLKVGDDPKRVLRNRVELTDACDLDEILFMDQVHSALMIRGVTGSDGSTCDGIYLRRDGGNVRTGLAVQVADCVPLILTSVELIAAVHVGREGLLKGMTEAALNAFESEGMTLTDVKAVIGPSICGHCYPLSVELFQACEQRYPATGFSVEERKIDVAAGVISILEEKGVRWRWFGDERECVSCDPDYFSYRRDRTTGRQAMVVAW